MPALRSAAILVVSFAAAVALAGCESSAPASSAPATVTARPSASAVSMLPATVQRATWLSTAAPASATTAPAARCATATGDGLPNSSITVCPPAGPVGSVVHVTIKGCAPGAPAAGMSFLGPDSWLGTNGGGGANVPYSPRTGSEASAKFTIPATYTGGNEDGPYPTLKVRPGTGYQFITDPAGECHVPFTVTAP